MAIGPRGEILQKRRLHTFYTYTRVSWAVSSVSVRFWRAHLGSQPLKNWAVVQIVWHPLIFHSIKDQYMRTKNLQKLNEPTSETKRLHKACRKISIRTKMVTMKKRLHKACRKIRIRTKMVTIQNLVKDAIVGQSGLRESGNDCANLLHRDPSLLHLLDSQKLPDPFMFLWLPFQEHQICSKYRIEKLIALIRILQMCCKYKKERIGIAKIMFLLEAAFATVFSKSGTETTCPMLAKMQWSVHSAMGCLYGQYQLIV